MAMSKRDWRFVAYSSFGSLGVMYLGIVAIILSATGASWIISANSPLEWAALLSITERLVAGILCVAVIVALASHPPARKVGLSLAWILALGTAAVMLADLTEVHAGPRAYLIGGLIVALHLWCVRAFHMATL